jgi:hypothetical protein
MLRFVQCQQKNKKDKISLTKEKKVPNLKQNKNSDYGAAQ